MIKISSKSYHSLRKYQPNSGAVFCNVKNSLKFLGPYLEVNDLHTITPVYYASNSSAPSAAGPATRRVQAGAADP